MKRIANCIAQLTLGRLLILLSAFSMVVAFSLLFAISGMVRDRAIHDLAREDARQTSQLVFQSLYSAMRKGWRKDEINETIERLNSVMPGAKIKVYRGEIVAHEFGEMEGERALIQKDSALNLTMSNGQDALLFPDKMTIRYMYPLLATQECLKCPTESHVGAGHGVVDITYPISNLKVSFNEVINTVVAYTLIVMGVVFIVLYFQLRYLVVLPIANLVGVMRNVTLNMDLSHRVSSSTWLQELKHLAEYFNHLLKTVQ